MTAAAEEEEVGHFRDHTAKKRCSRTTHL
jgi:hypothetical protein